MQKVKVSAVSYTNTLPFLQGIKSSPIIDEIDLSVDYPAECARKVINDEVDMGIIPVAALLDLQNYHLITDYCIGSNGAVDSVFIFSSKPIADVKTLCLDEQSRTSNGLARILLKYYWKVKVELVADSSVADSFVLIGDRTFGRKDEFKYVYDLGEIWKEFTGLPFAYAVWVSNKILPDQFITSFNKALADGVSRAEEVVSDLPEISKFDYTYYLTHNLDYHLNEEKRQAIAKYLELLEDLH